MRKSVIISAFLFGATLVGGLAAPRDAAACGGCFGPPPPPTETATVVTDHRMILSVGRDKSTLWDQIRYQGSPDSFAWVLPISGEVQIGLSSDVVFGTLDAMTTTTIQAPPQNCPPPPNCGRGSSSSGGYASASGAEDSAPQDPGVEVTKRETVGPYDTVQLKATDPAALEKWLQQNGFVIPGDVKPVIDQYVAEHFDFLALKLLPGKEVKDMRPVRVTTPGANVVLPLRMVAAGTGATVGITLWTLGEGRYEPQNFPTFAIKADELEWDWTTEKSNYTDLRAAKTAASQGKGWEIESSSSIDGTSFANGIKYGYYGGRGPGGGGPAGDPSGAGSDYLPVKDDNGNVTKTAEQVRDEDLGALMPSSLAYGFRATRVRADLAHAALATDLVLAAAPDQSPLPAFRQVTKEKNQPNCPIYDGSCNQVGTAPRDEAQARANGGSESFACETTPSHHSTQQPAWLAVAGAAVAAAVVRASRQRLRKS